MASSRLKDEAVARIEGVQAKLISLVQQQRGEEILRYVCQLTTDVVVSVGMVDPSLIGIYLFPRQAQTMTARPCILVSELVPPPNRTELSIFGFIAIDAEGLLDLAPTDHEKLPILSAVARALGKWERISAPRIDDQGELGNLATALNWLIDRIAGYDQLSPFVTRLRLLLWQDMLNRAASFSSIFEDSGPDEETAPSQLDRWYFQGLKMGISHATLLQTVLHCRLLNMRFRRTACLEAAAIASESAIFADDKRPLSHFVQKDLGSLWFAILRHGELDKILAYAKRFFNALPMRGVDLDAVRKQIVVTLSLGFSDRVRKVVSALGDIAQVGYDVSGAPEEVVNAYLSPFALEAYVFASESGHASRGAHMEQLQQDFPSPLYATLTQHVLSGSARS